MVQWVTYLPGKHKDVNLNPGIFTKSGKHWETDMWVPGVAVQLGQLKQVLSSVRDPVSNTRIKSDIKRHMCSRRLLDCFPAAKIPEIATQKLY